MTTGVPPRTLGHGELLQLRRWNTPTIYNGWERITRHDVAAAGFNNECQTLLAAALGTEGLPPSEILESVADAAARFSADAAAHFREAR
jgi:hypothetical protein